MTSHPTVKDLSPDQRAAYDAITRWADDAHEGDADQVLTLAGYAGSGKSTVVTIVSENLPPPIAFCAYTGKASSVLKRKLDRQGVRTIGTQPVRDGVRSFDERPYCGTIHSLIFRPCDCREPTHKTVHKPCPVDGCGVEMFLDEGGVTCVNGHGGVVDREDFDAVQPKTQLVYAQKDENGRCRICGGKEWLRKEILDRDYKLIIVDEAGMIDDALLRDLKSFGVPILAVGDHGQLPPVGGVGSLMKNPSLRLEKIHRQAEGNPIIALSKMIREEGRLPESLPGDAVRFGKLRFLEQAIEERYGDADAKRLLDMGIVVYTNRRRVGTNVAVRRVLGTARKGTELPSKGEHVVCLRNMKPTRGSGDEPIYNGMRGVLASNVEPKKIYTGNSKEPKLSTTQIVGTISFPEDGIKAREYEMLAAQFGREKTFSSTEELAKETGIFSFSMAGALFDFGYAMTAHKMQGSQVDDLLLLVERPGMVDDDGWRRWLYTSVTRAASRLTVLR
jgi:exodeoxyribonuclease V